MTENNEVIVNGELSNNINMKNKNTGNSAIKTLDASILDKVIIYTGNVMKQANINSFDCRRNNQELISALTDTLKAQLYTKSMWAFDKTNGVLEIPDPFYSNQKLTEDRTDYEITAKLFYLPSSLTSPSTPPQYITQSIYHLFKLLGIDTIDTFIIYFNGLRFDGSSHNDTNDEMNKNDLIKAWKELEKLYVNNRIHKLGVSEFTKNRLENFLKVVEIPPKIDQVNTADCNNIREILAFAKKNDIELLTHRDPAVILPSKTFQKIIEETNTYKVSLNSELSPRWVLKYSVMIKCRGVVANKGYIVMGSTPNSDSNFTYTINPIAEKDV